MKHPKPDPLLEFRALGEIPDALRSKADRDQRSPEVVDRVRSLRDSDRRILEELPVEEMVKGIRKRLDAPEPTMTTTTMSGWWRWAIVPALGLGLLASLLVFPLERDRADMVADFNDSLPRMPAFPNLDESKTKIVLTTSFRPRSQDAKGMEGDDRIALAEPIDDGIRTKGDVPRLRVHLVDADRLVATALGDGDTVAAGAQLQVSLLAGPSLWVAVVSIDAAGTVTRHLPEQGDSAILAKGTLQAPHSFQLDSSPGFERFVLVRSEKPFAIPADPLTLSGKPSGSGPHLVQSIRLVKREELP